MNNAQSTPSLRSRLLVEGSLAALSVLATLFVASVAEWSAPGGSWHFTALAEWLTGTPLPSPQPLQVRDFGYPLFIVLLGKNPNAVMAAQFVMAAALPLLVFWQVAWINRTIAWLAGCAVILSLAPYQFVAWFHHDQLFIFALTASCTLTLWTLRKPSTALVMLTALSWFLASISRPAANLSGLFCFALLAIIVRARRQTLIVAMLAFTAAFVLYGQWKDCELARLGVVDYAGSQLFFTAYVSGAEVGVHLNESDDPAVKSIADGLMTATQDLVRRAPSVVGWLTALGFSPAVENRVFPPDVFNVSASGRQMSDFVLAHPTQDYFEFISFATQDDYALLGRAASASFRRHPFAYSWLGVQQTALFLLKPGWAYGRTTDPRGGQLSRQILGFYFLGRNTSDGQLVLMPRNFQMAFAKKPDTKFSTAVSRFMDRGPLAAGWAVFYGGLTKISLIALLVGFVIAVRTKQQKLVEGLIVIGVPHFVIVGLTGLVVGPDYRYHFMAVPEAIALGALGVCAVSAAYPGFLPVSTATEWVAKRADLNRLRRW